MADEKTSEPPSIHTTPAADPAAVPVSQRHAVDDDIIYTKDVQPEKGVVPESSSLDSAAQKTSDKDAEAGESYPKRAFYRRYSKYTKYIKHVVYAAIWILFTG